MPKKRAAKGETLLDMCGGDEAKAAAVQRIIGMCGFDYLLWIEGERDLWAKITTLPTLTDAEKDALQAEIERRCPPAVWADFERHRAAYQRISARMAEREAAQ